jgi:hypothetical protein
MDHTQQQIERLSSMVDTARQEIELAIMFHETWRPAAYDAELKGRIGTSYAAHAFQIIRMSLRRELLLALARLWDKSSKTVRMIFIAKQLRDKKLFGALVQFRTQKLSPRLMLNPDPLMESLTPMRDEILSIIDKYDNGGSASEVLTKLMKLRHERLAHRKLPDLPINAAEADAPGQRVGDSDGPVWATDDEIEAFYQDNLEIVRLLLSLVQGVGFDLPHAAKLYKSHAKCFWASARGERTEGHPNYRPPTLDSH